MATVKVPLDIQAAVPVGSNVPEYKEVAGTNMPVAGLYFDAGADEACGWRIAALNYGSGNITLKFQWYADTASSGDVVCGGAIAAITPNTDTQDIETDALATEATVTDTHLGTTAQRLHQAEITISSLDSLAADDDLFVRFRRLGLNGSDTLSGDMILTKAWLEYSDT